MTAGHRSIHPNIPGVPWWAAIVIAVTATAVGFAFDAGSGNKELTDVFSALYVLGCVAAVLAVRQSGVFTAAIQPPLILFCAVPGAYWLFHGAKLTGLKDLLINCGYPLIERFPLMLFTSAGVLLIGMIRWYLGLAVRGTANTEPETADSGGGINAIIGKLAALIGGNAAEPEHSRKPGKAPARARRTEPAGRRTKSAQAAGARTAKRPAPTRSRHIRPPLEEPLDPAIERARRRRPARTRDVDASEPPRRSRVPRDPDLRGRPPREIRRDPHLRRGRPTARSSRFDPYEPTEGYEPVEPVEPRRRPAPSGATATHHPISQVRYRRSPGADDSRKSRKSKADSWEYDI
ncbi:hypothetical protein A5707_19140 [Mycobacterium kyorinense]|uniref:DUF6542 domain-containing protein n=1 Tax=Mycobacterium kyorinense TaxID=487514 RepID=A0A1A2ZD40_9MYCO|nr:hypothetical protein A5707_19140 [Mycobacterium kyorinense]